MESESEYYVAIAIRISNALTAELLALRTRLLVKDIMLRYDCGRSAAMKAITMARVRVGTERRHAR